MAIDDSTLTCPQSEVRTAAEFVDSIGVATHLSYSRTPYGRVGLVQELLQDLGIRHIRDGWPSDDKALAQRALDLADAGVGITFVHDPREGGTPDEQHRAVRDNLLPALEAAESLNEPDANVGDDWAQKSIDWTEQLSAAYRGDPRTDDIPLLAPSISQVNDAAAHEALAPLKGTVDYGNAHDYPGKDLVMNDRIMDTVLRNQAKIVGRGIVVATETGYSDGPGDAPYKTLPQEEIAKLLPGLFLDHFRRGIDRTFAYELLDEGPGRLFEENFGLVEYDGTPKPSYTSLRNLIRLLSEPEEACGQRPLKWTVEDASRDVRTLALSGGQDQYFLALWRQTPPSKAKKQTVRVRIANPVDTVHHYEPSVSEQAVGVTEGGQVDVELFDSVVLLVVDGAGAAPSPSPAPSSS